MEAARTLPTNPTSLNRRIRKSKEWMALSAPLSNCSTHWRRRAKKASPRNQRIDPITSRGIPRFRSVEMEIAVVLVQSNSHSEQIAETLLGKDSRLGSVSEAAPFAQKDHRTRFGNDF